MTRQELRDWKAELVSDIEEHTDEMKAVAAEIRDLQTRFAGLKQAREDRKCTLAYVQGQLTSIKAGV